VPLQIAGGIDGPEQVELAFAAGATRVVMPLLAVAEEPERLAACLAIAGDWLAVGLDPRPERLREYPWRSGIVPSLEELVDALAGAGVRRFVLSHGGSEPDLRMVAGLVAGRDADFLVAGGITDLAGISRLRDAGVTGLILGEALLGGLIDYQAALEAARAAA
jgi:phosphoribosylformimino-5-aminoimidazole carboxamide ribonucleotide (ProFAR) isomerase